MVCSSVVTLTTLEHTFAMESLIKNRPVCWSIVVKEKPNIGSPFFGAFLSVYIHKATNDVNVQFFVHS